MKTRNYTIKDIESMSAADLASFAEDVETIKGHTVYYIDFGGAFGFSACVCASTMPSVKALRPTATKR